MTCKNLRLTCDRDYVEMIKEKWLSDAIFTTVGLKADLSNVKTTAGDFQTAALSDAVNTSENNEATFLAWHERASIRRSTLVFCVDVRHIVDLTATFRRHGVDARYVTGETPAKLRSETLEAFKSFQFPVLLNCGVFTEGTDVPNIDCVLLARPTKSQSLLVQMVGRGLRLYPGKDNCHIIDLVSSLKSGVITTPTLFGLDPDETVEGASSEELGVLQSCKEAEKNNTRMETADITSTPGKFDGTITFTDYDSIEDLLADRAGDQHIRALSQYTWVQVGLERYILTTMAGNYIALAKIGDHYIATYTERLPSSKSPSGKSPFMRPRTIAKGINLQNAVHSADTFAKKVFPHIFISKHQPWRNAQASEKQLEALNKTRDKDHQLKAGDLTKGMAIDMITKLKFGAKGRFNKITTKRQKAVREQETLEKKLKSLQPPKIEVWNRNETGEIVEPTPLLRKLKELWQH
jgi:ATP-dependent helicase IRC3